MSKLPYKTIVNGRSVFFLKHATQGPTVSPQEESFPTLPAPPPPALHILPGGHEHGFVVAVYFEKMNSAFQIQRTSSKYNWSKNLKYIFVSKHTSLVSTDRKLGLLLVYKLKKIYKIIRYKEWYQFHMETPRIGNLDAFRRNCLSLPPNLPTVEFYQTQKSGSGLVLFVQKTVCGCASNTREKERQFLLGLKRLEALACRQRWGEGWRKAAGPLVLSPGPQQAIDWPLSPVPTTCPVCMGFPLR